MFAYIIPFIIIHSIESIISKCKTYVLWNGDLFRYFTLFCGLYTTYYISVYEASHLCTTNLMLLIVMPLLLNMVLTSFCDIILLILHSLIVIGLMTKIDYDKTPNILLPLYKQTETLFFESFLFFELLSYLSISTKSFLPMVLWYSSFINYIPHVLEIILMSCFLTLVDDFKYKLQSLK